MPHLVISGCTLQLKDLSGFSNTKNINRDLEMKNTMFRFVTETTQLHYWLLVSSCGPDWTLWRAGFGLRAAYATSLWQSEKKKTNLGFL